MTRNLHMAHARTKREEPWLALVQCHKRGVFGAALPLGWILICSVAWCCSGGTVCTLNNLLGSSRGSWAECWVEVKEGEKETKCGYLGVVKFGSFVQNALLYAHLQLGAITFSIKEDICKGYSNQEKSFMWMCGRWCEGNISFFGDLLPHFSHYYCLPSLLRSPYDWLSLWHRSSCWSTKEQLRGDSWRETGLILWVFVVGYSGVQRGLLEDLGNFSC